MNDAYHENQRKNRGGVMNVWMKHDLNQDYETPRPKSRVGCSIEAEEYMQRNRGTVILGGPGGGYPTPRAPRVHGQEAETSYNRAQGTVGNLMNLQANKGYVSPRPNPRVKDEASDNAERNHNGTMKTLLDSNKNKNYYTPRPEPRVKMEATGAASRNKGVMNHVLNSAENKSYYNARSAPRVRPEAEANALRNSGTMNKFMDMSKPMPPTAREQRIKPEAKENYDKNRGSLTHTYYNFGTFNESNATVPKVHGQGQGIANVGRNGTCKFLFEKYGNLPKDPPNAARVKPEAQRYARKGQGSIAAMLGTKGYARKSAKW